MLLVGIDWAEDGIMLLVGIDWAEAAHAVCLMDATGTVHRRVRVPHSAAGRRRLRAAVAEHEPAPGAVLVALTS